MVAAETYISQFSCILLADSVMDNIGISLPGWSQEVLMLRTYFSVLIL